MKSNDGYDSPLAPSRRVLREGTFNARDAGGYPLLGGGWMARGRLYRSDALSALTENDIDEFKRLGIRSVIDLRDLRESAVAPDIVDRRAVRYERVAIFEDRLFERDMTAFPSLLGLYQIIMDDHVPQLIRVLKLLSEVSGEPVLVHCTAGKDRTGLILALVHAIAGLPPQVIVEDYGASEKILGGGFDDRIRALYRQAAIPVAVLGDNPRHAPPAYLQHTLETMRTAAGSIPAFLARNGLSPTEQERLAHNLTR
ncbi:MAG: tyrosine-protein phosphatase [Rhizobiaceae bacterium]|nr:tyrosine-protein phosphatase [Rhizobiaceae bacterium]